eukprot:PITA_13330
MPGEDEEPVGEKASHMAEGGLLVVMRKATTVPELSDQWTEVIIGSTDNVVSTEMVEKLELKCLKHPTPYKVSWLQKGHQLLVDEQCEVEFQIGRYKDKVVCDIMLMDVCHILLGRPRQYDRKMVHDGLTNCYKFVKDRIKHTLVPIKEEGTTRTSEPRSLRVSGKQFMKQVEDSDMGYAVVKKAKTMLLHTEVSDLPTEIQ